MSPGTNTHCSSGRVNGLLLENVCARSYEDIPCISEYK